MFDDPFAFAYQHEQFLRRIAKEVDQLIHKDPINLDHFRQQVGAFVKKSERYLSGKAPNKQNPPYLLGPVLSVQDWDPLPAPQSQQDLLPDFYFILTLIHDNILTIPQFVPINNELYRTDDDWVKCCWDYYKSRAANGKEKTLIEAALEHVKSDLAKLNPEETDSQCGKFGFHPKEPSE